LVDNRAFRELRDLVRWALDFYAMQEAKRALEEAEAERDVEPVRQKVERVDQVLDRYKDAIPTEPYRALRREINDVVRASESEAELAARQAGLLGALATAGISALAYEHEVGKQLEELRAITAQLQRPSGDAGQDLRAIAQRLSSWIERAQGTRALLSPLLNEENRDRVTRLRARPLVDEVRRQVAILLRGVHVDTSDVPPDLLLPKARFIEWSAILQNLFVNAVNAMMDSPQKLIRVSSQVRGQRRLLRVEDTGVGVDLSDADELFKPFVRRLNVSPERRRLGMGGTGLGLTIVRMIASNIGCTVRFADPSAGFSTAVEITWSEQRD
jgi:signal transduction histidine kinase